MGHTARYIRGLLPSLIPSEARVAEALLAADESVLDFSVARLAAEAGTSRATVVRACQSFGFSGLSELKQALALEAAAPAKPPASARDGFVAAQASIAAGIQQLESMSTMLDRGQFELAVNALGAARRRVFVTSSDLALLGQYAVFRFAMIGRAAEAPTDVITAHAVAATLAAGDVCVAVGHSGTNALTLRIARAAADAGATVIAITSFARGPLADLAAIHLVVGVPDSPPGVEPLTRIRVSQMVAIDALQAALALSPSSEGSDESQFRTLSQYVYRRARHQRAAPRRDT